ncbi:MAG TPA: CHASE2 domain-containing protein [Candidatus Limnocylindrales bacterium]|nr:CHASE2 domain-containing protein [Candidatus Limnocylindrales bacterium]
MRRVFIWINLGLVSLAAASASSGTLSPFAFVMIDAQTEAVYGSLPFNRAVVATAIDRLTAAKAKGIVIKFFYDLPSTEKHDQAFEQSICGAAVALQASLNNTEGKRQRLESKFQVNAVPIADFPAAFRGDKALIPLQRFRRCAKAVGFVDSTASEFPLMEVYLGKMVKSLQLVALEMASNQKAEVDSAGFVKLGTARLAMMHSIDFPSTNSLSYIPLHEVVSNTSKAWQAKVQGAVVILGYDGKNIHSMQTPLGPLGAHRFFISGLTSLANTFEKENGIR